MEFGNCSGHAISPQGISNVHATIKMSCLVKRLATHVHPETQLLALTPIAKEIMSVLNVKHIVYIKLSHESSPILYYAATTRVPAGVALPG